MITPKKLKKGGLKAKPGKDVFGNNLKDIKKKSKAPKERYIPKGFPKSKKRNVNGIKEIIPKSFPKSSKGDTLELYKNEGMSDAVFLPNIKKKKKK